jgi:hypothetical protein
MVFEIGFILVVFRTLCILPRSRFLLIHSLTSGETADCPPPFQIPPLSLSLGGSIVLLLRSLLRVLRSDWASAKPIVRQVSAYKEHPDPVVRPYVHGAGTLHFRDKSILLLRMSLQPSSSVGRQLDPL